MRDCLRFQTLPVPLGSIFSGAMKDHHRALLVGQRTFGKGSVQNLIPIGRRGAEALMKLTMSYYLLPNKESIHRRDGARTWGVDPDVQVELTPKQLAELIKQRRDAEIIRNGHTPATSPGTAVPSTKKRYAVASGEADNSDSTSRVHVPVAMCDPSMNEAVRRRSAVGASGRRHHPECLRQ